MRGSYYYGELEGRTGLVALNHVEKCEWIYGDLAIDKGQQSKQYTIRSCEYCVEQIGIFWNARNKFQRLKLIFFVMTRICTYGLFVKF